VATGALASFMQVGAGLALALTGTLVGEIGWRWVMVLFALPGFVWAAMFHWWFRDLPEDHPRVNDAELTIIGRGRKTDAADRERPATPWRLILLNFDIWMICGQQFFRAAGYIFFSTWFPEYLRVTYGVSVAGSGFLASLPILVAIFGSLAGGVIVDWIWNRTASRRLSRQGVAMFAMLSCAAFIGIAFQCERVLPAVVWISAGSFCAAMAGPCAYTVTIDKSAGVVAPVFGLMNMSGNIGAAACPLVVGGFVQLTGNAWYLVLLLFIGNYVFAAICWAVLNPDGTILDKHRRRHAPRDECGIGVELPGRIHHAERDGYDEEDNKS
jgi:nitrate/nitrite transporter NarK